MNETIPVSPLSDDQFRNELKSIYKHREYFKTIEYSHADISSWLIQSANDTLKEFGTTAEENEKLLTSFDLML